MHISIGLRPQLVFDFYYMPMVYHYVLFRYRCVNMKVFTGSPKDQSTSYEQLSGTFVTPLNHFLIEDDCWHATFECDLDTVDDNDYNDTEWCICRQPEDHRKMIECSNTNCKTQWFHVSCIKMKRVPKGEWFCTSCRAKNKRKRKRQISSDSETDSKWARFVNMEIY